MKNRKPRPRYTVSEEFTKDGITQFRVSLPNQATWQAVGVWVGSDDTPRCVECSGRLVAMLANCPHARAVKRYIARNH